MVWLSRVLLFYPPNNFCCKFSDTSNDEYLFLYRLYRINQKRHKISFDDFSLITPSKFYLEQYASAFGHECSAASRRRHLRPSTSDHPLAQPSSTDVVKNFGRNTSSAVIAAEEALFCSTMASFCCCGGCRSTNRSEKRWRAELPQISSSSIAFW